MISLSLTQTAEYALRAMSSLALSPGQEPVRANDLAQRTGVPLAYLWKIMRRMVAAGLVLSSKGHGGGFRLARPADSITYMDILGVTGYDAKAGSCVFGWGQCRNDRPCPMHSTWSKLNDAFIAWAHSTSLASLGASAFVANPSRGRPGASPKREKRPAAK